LLPQLDSLALRGLARDQGERFDSARAMALELESAARPATPAEVGEWVVSLAEESLRERMRKVARLEEGTAGAHPPSGPRVTEDAETAADLPVGLRPEQDADRDRVAGLLAKAMDLLRPRGPRE
jgi:hypothetical protein